MFIFCLFRQHWLLYTHPSQIFLYTCTHASCSHWSVCNVCVCVRACVEVCSNCTSKCLLCRNLVRGVLSDSKRKLHVTLSIIAGFGLWLAALICECFRGYMYLSFCASVCKKEDLGQVWQGWSHALWVQICSQAQQCVNVFLFVCVHNSCAFHAYRK